MSLINICDLTISEQNPDVIFNLFHKQEIEDEEKIRWPTIFQYVLGGLLHTHNFKQIYANKQRPASSLVNIQQTIDEGVPITSAITRDESILSKDPNKLIEDFDMLYGSNLETLYKEHVKIFFSALFLIDEVHLFNLLHTHGYLVPKITAEDFPNDPRILILGIHKTKKAKNIIGNVLSLVRNKYKAISQQQQYILDEGDKSHAIYNLYLIIEFLKNRLLNKPYNIDDYKQNTINEILNQISETNFAGLNKEILVQLYQNHHNIPDKWEEEDGYDYIKEMRYLFNNGLERTIEFLNQKYKPKLRVKLLEIRDFIVLKCVMKHHNRNSKSKEDIDQLLQNMDKTELKQLQSRVSKLYYDGVFRKTKDKIIEGSINKSSLIGSLDSIEELCDDLYHIEQFLNSNVDRNIPSRREISLYGCVSNGKCKENPVGYKDEEMFSSKESCEEYCGKEIDYKDNYSKDELEKTESVDGYSNVNITTNDKKVKKYMRYLENAPISIRKLERNDHVEFDLTDNIISQLKSQLPDDLDISNFNKVDGIITTLNESEPLELQLIELQEQVVELQNNIQNNVDKREQIVSETNTTKDGDTFDLIQEEIMRFTEQKLLKEEEIAQILKQINTNYNEQNVQIKVLTLKYIDQDGFVKNIYSRPTIEQITKRRRSAKERSTLKDINSLSGDQLKEELLKRSELDQIKRIEVSIKASELSLSRESQISDNFQRSILPKINEYKEMMQPRTTVRESSKISSRSNNDIIEILHNPYTQYTIDDKLVVKIDDYFFNSLSSYLYYVELLQFPREIIKNKEEAYKLLLEDGYLLSADGKFSNFTFKTDDQIRITRNKMVFEVIKMRVNNILKIKFSDKFINNRNFMISKHDTTISSKDCNLNQSYYIGQWAQQELYNYIVWYLPQLRNNIITTVSNQYTREYMNVVEDIINLINKEYKKQAKTDSKARKKLAKLLLLNSDNFIPNLDDELIDDYSKFISTLNRTILVDNPWDFNSLYNNSLGTSLIGTEGGSSEILRTNIKKLLKDFYEEDLKTAKSFYEDSKFSSKLIPAKNILTEDDEVITEEIVSKLKYPRVLKPGIKQEGKKVEMNQTEQKLRQIKRNIENEYIEKRQHGRNLLKNIMGAIVIVIKYGFNGKISEKDLQIVTRIIMGNTNSIDQKLDNLDYETYASKSTEYTSQDKLVANDYISDEEISFKDGLNVGIGRNISLTIGENDVDQSIRLIFILSVDIFRFIMSNQFNTKQIYLRLLILNNSITEQIE